MAVLHRRIVNPDTGTAFFIGTGSPVGLAAPQGSTYYREDGGAGTTIYEKYGSGVNDWAALASVTGSISSPTFNIDGGGSVLTTGIAGIMRVGFACTIAKVSLMAPKQAGSVVVDVWKDAWANGIPTVADTITAAAKPTLSTAQQYEDSTLTGWTTSLAAGDQVVINIDSVTTLTFLGVHFDLQRV